MNAATAEIEALVRRLDELNDDEARTTAHALVQSLMDMHAEAFEKMISMCDSPALLQRFAGDELIGSLLLLYGLHPEPIDRRVEAALERVRPYLRSHGGSVRLAAITDDGVVRLQLDGSCNGCPSSARTIKLAIEDAIFEAAPEVRIVIAADIPSAAVSGRWESVGDLASLADKAGRMIDVAGQRLFVCRSGENLYAWGSTCPGCHASLGDAAVDSRSLSCGKCGRRFDLLAAGRDIEDPVMHLEPYPLLIERGQARVALP